jgi:hypothetical protein
MTMQTDVLSDHIEATGLMVSGRARLKGYQCLSGGTAGDVVFTDGTVGGGTERLRFNIPNNTNNPFSNIIPGQGILFNTGIFVTVPTGAKITIFYG